MLHNCQLFPKLGYTNLVGVFYRGEESIRYLIFIIIRNKSDLKDKGYVSVYHTLKKNGVRGGLEMKIAVILYVKLYGDSVAN